MHPAGEHVDRCARSCPPLCSNSALVPSSAVAAGVTTIPSARDASNVCPQCHEKEQAGVQAPRQGVKARKLAV